MRFSTLTAALVATFASLAAAQIDVFNVPNATIGQCEGLALMWSGDGATKLQIFDATTGGTVPIASFALSGNVHLWTANLAVGAKFRMSIREDDANAHIVRWGAAQDGWNSSIFTVVEGNDSCRLLEY